MRLESSVNLLVATLDLNLVRLVRAAMHAADAGATCDPRRFTVPCPLIEPRKRHEPDPVIEPRKHIHPEPVFEPRPKHRPEAVNQDDCPGAVEVTRVDPKSSASPIQPPWKVLPWENPPAEPARPIRRVKLVVGPPDLCSKGNVIDLFI